MAIVTPKLKLFEICGPGYVFNSRAPDNASEWIFGDPGLSDAVTGNQLIVVGNMPVLCSAGVATNSGLDLLREIGFNLEAQIVTFTDEEDRLYRMKSLAEKGFSCIDQHAQPDENLHPGTSWVGSSILSFLNNKSNLHQLVPSPYLPIRKSCDPSSLIRFAKQLERFPLVIKVATKNSSGSGRGIRACHNESDLKQAQEFFGRCETVIVEDFISMHNNLCLNYAIFPDGKIEYLGGSRQIVNDELNYLGNWLEPGAEPPSDLIKVGGEVMTRAWRLGYRGFAGFDAAVMDNGTFFIYDLNFRFNGSTTPILIFDSLANRFGLPVAKFLAWNYTGGFIQMIASLKKVAEKYCFIPFSTYDPAAWKKSSLKPRVSALLFGRTRDEVQLKEKELHNLRFQSIQRDR